MISINMSVYPNNIYSFIHRGFVQDGQSCHFHRYLHKRNLKCTNMVILNDYLDLNSQKWQELITQNVKKSINISRGIIEFVD